MSLFGNFENPLKSNVGNNHTNDPDDIVKTKRHLSKLGYFADNTEVPFITKEMENGIIRYQKDKKLRIDGIMKPGGETERSIFEVLTKKPADILWDYKEDDSIGIGFGGNITGTLPPRKVPKIREDSLIQERTQKQKEAPQPPPTQAERVLGSIDAITAAINAAKGNTKRSRENRGVFKTTEILARVHEEAKRRKEIDVMSISDEKYFASTYEENRATSKPVSRPSDGKTSSEYIFERSVPRSDESVETNLKKTDNSHNIETFLGSLFDEEGGYTTGEKDRRGPTKIGVNKPTLNEYEDWKKSKGEPLPEDYTTDVTKVTPELAKKIYKEMYYERYNIDKIENEAIAGNVLDGTINQGPERTAKWLQESLNDRLGVSIEVDGVLGPQTRDAIKEAETQGIISDVNNDLVEKRIEAYKNTAKIDPTQDGFLAGWIDRANRLKIPPNPVKRPDL